MSGESVELDLNWFWVDCDGCGGLIRSDKLKLIEKDIGKDVVQCPWCDEVIGVVEENID